MDRNHLRGALSRFDAAKLPAGYVATDAMGNDLRKEGAVPLTPVPFFVSAEGVAPAALAETIGGAIGL